MYNTSSYVTEADCFVTIQLYYKENQKST